MIKMANTRQLFSVVLLLVILNVATAQGPVHPYRRFKSRPKFNPYCQAGVVPFCPTGRVDNTMPRFHDFDKIEVYALKAPVFEFKLGDLLGKFHIMHDAMAFKNLDTGFNYTLEWYELVELFNCTFAHTLEDDSMIWCNQGAACIYDGVDDKHWLEYGTLVKVAEITGAISNQFAEWVEWDNNTAIYYETWTVWDEPGGQMWFDSFDCASFVIRAFQELANLGTEFNQSVHLNYTRINLYSDKPVYLGNDTVVKANESLYQNITDFYKKFQSHQSFQDLMTHLIEGYDEVFEDHMFYLYYNFEYWFLPMKQPYMKLTYFEKPLPKANNTDTLYFQSYGSKKKLN
ncbi:ceroid-lipofuscinosis neuronal protein 5 homolog [Mya arenaria]|uniref:ceroid-lipofuscinosis neuronal protein 5 homolog n=1 Tax=Mya arenaria TaxID=6604 RepID=UPI0022E6F1F5|nr:ceroid-lipofuscinosis neuronal protein 5 homolog [Mya arenaria]